MTYEQTACLLTYSVAPIPWGTGALWVEEQQTLNWLNCTDHHKSAHQNDYNCALEPKRGEARLKNFPDRCPSILLWTGATPPFKFVPTPLYILSQIQMQPIMSTLDSDRTKLLVVTIEIQAFNGEVKVKNQVFSYNMIRWFSAHPLKSCWCSISGKGRTGWPKNWHIFYAL